MTSMMKGYDRYLNAGRSRSGMGIAGLGQIGAPFFYVPDLLPVGSKASYFPRDTVNDAKALNFLGFMSDGALDDHASLGSQSADMSNETGAWDPAFRAAVTRFQASAGLTVDSWVGPATRTALAKAVALKNAGTPIPVAPGVIPVNPGQVPGGNVPIPGATPVNDRPGSDDTMTYVAVGAGALVLLGAGWYLLT